MELERSLGNLHIFSQMARTALSETLAKALDGVDPALRLARAAARAARRGKVASPWCSTASEVPKLGHKPPATPG